MSKQIKIINESNNQVMRFVIETANQTVDVFLRYVEQQQGWFISFSYLDFTANSIRVVTSGNFLHQFRNLIPFGLSCVVEGNQEPMLQKDFSSGRAKLYLLNQAEVTAYSEVISGQATA